MEKKGGFIRNPPKISAPYRTPNWMLYERGAVERRTALYN